LGLSMGGRAAFMYAAKNPTRVERLVIVDIAPETDSTGANRISQGVRANDLFDTPEDAVKAARAATPPPPHDGVRGRVLNNLIQRRNGKWTYRYDVALRNGSGARVMPTPEEVAQTWESLRNITAPTLLIRGVESDVLSPALAKRMVETIPDCRLIEVPDAGHSVPGDSPSGFLAAIKTFL